ncbi:hypothetical protein MCA1520 [Methylococcus capsulatus str. Bath]|uniref:Uncharacterized protein n=1 Tax=Methylococcus capsulatus (strain ATCC 33009 / NCIMB 11132 / Bath) TaxID=243233 RepID=Q608H1_METCA|nr:hypothetical protein MCA1520 [Methylococcus capsulatus str. Bath]
MGKRRHRADSCVTRTGSHAVRSARSGNGRGGMLGIADGAVTPAGAQIRPERKDAVRSAGGVPDTA